MVVPCSAGFFLGGGASGGGFGVVVAVGSFYLSSMPGAYRDVSFLRCCGGVLLGSGSPSAG